MEDMDGNSNQASGLSASGAFEALSAPAGAQNDPGVVMPVPAQVQTPPALADDELEALDQDWVNKAKDIVERTKNDPFVQSNELSKIKNGYLKARYNKDIGAEEHS